MPLIRIGNIKHQPVADNDAYMKIDKPFEKKYVFALKKYKKVHSCKYIISLQNLN